MLLLSGEARKFCLSCTAQDKENPFYPFPDREQVTGQAIQDFAGDPDYADCHPIVFHQPTDSLKVDLFATGCCDDCRHQLRSGIQDSA